MTKNHKITFNSLEEVKDAIKAMNQDGTPVNEKLFINICGGTANHSKEEIARIKQAFEELNA
jgi:hypothetical protein